MSKWREIWEKKQDDETAASLLSKLLSANGYDALAAITPAVWIEYLDRIASKIDLRPGDSVFEVGCGAGALLLPLWESGHPVGGLDFSSRQIDRAREAMSGVDDFAVGEAVSLAEQPAYDSVLSSGTFLYFPDLTYAEAVLRRMVRKSKRSVAILDVPDLAKKEEILRWRKEALGEENYNRRYAGLDHLYYDKEWFRGLFKQIGLDCAIEDQILRDYNHSRFRFNVFAWKAESGGGAESRRGRLAEPSSDLPRQGLPVG